MKIHKTLVTIKVKERSNSWSHFRNYNPIHSRLKSRLYTNTFHVYLIVIVKVSLFENVEQVQGLKSFSQLDHQVEIRLYFTEDINNALCYSREKNISDTILMYFQPHKPFLTFNFGNLILIACFIMQDKRLVGKVIIIDTSIISVCSFISYKECVQREFKRNVAD